MPPQHRRECRLQNAGCAAFCCTRTCAARQRPSVPDKKERFRGAHLIGWLIEAVAILLFAGAAVLGVWDGVRSAFGFLQFFGRFLVMLNCLEIYDILFFDWVLLCHSNFFPYFYPELKGIVGPHMFGYNKKQHILHFVAYIPACAAAAWLCTCLF